MRMRLAEAIRLGSLILKPIAGRVFDGNGNGCALGMGCAAIGVQLRIAQTNLSDVYETFPWTMRTLENYEVCCKEISHCNVAQGIAHAFDVHVMQSTECVSKDHPCLQHPWTLEKLVDWVDSLEPKEQVSAQPAVRDEELYGQVTRLTPCF